MEPAEFSAQSEILRQLLRDVRKSLYFDQEKKNVVFKTVGYVTRGSSFNFRLILSWSDNNALHMATPLTPFTAFQGSSGIKYIAAIFYMTCEWLLGVTLSVRYSPLLIHM